MEHICAEMNDVYIQGEKQFILQEVKGMTVGKNFLEEEQYEIQCGGRGWLWQGPDQFIQ